MYYRENLNFVHFAEPLQTRKFSVLLVAKKPTPVGYRVLTVATRFTLPVHHPEVLQGLQLQSSVLFWNPNMGTTMGVAPGTTIEVAQATIMGAVQANIIEKKASWGICSPRELKTR